MLLPIAWPGRTALGLFVMMEVGQYVLQVTKFQTGKPCIDWFHVIYLNEGRILLFNCNLIPGVLRLIKENIDCEEGRRTCHVIPDRL